MPRPHDVVEAKHDVVEAKHDVIEAKHDVIEAKHDVIKAKHDVICLLQFAKSFFPCLLATTHRTGGPPLVLNSEMARAFVLSVRSSGRAAPSSGRAFALSVLGNGPSVRPLLLRSRSLFAAHVPCLLA